MTNAIDLNLDNIELNTGYSDSNKSKSNTSSRDSNNIEANSKPLEVKTTNKRIGRPRKIKTNKRGRPKREKN